MYYFWKMWKSPGQKAEQEEQGTAQLLQTHDDNGQRHLQRLELRSHSSAAYTKIKRGRELSKPPKATTTFSNSNCSTQVQKQGEPFVFTSLQILWKAQQENQEQHWEQVLGREILMGLEWNPCLWHPTTASKNHWKSDQPEWKRWLQNASIGNELHAMWEFVQSWTPCN